MWVHAKMGILPNYKQESGQWGVVWRHSRKHPRVYNMRASQKVVEPRNSDQAVVNILGKNPVWGGSDPYLYI